MTSFPILDLVIGMIFIYFLLSIMTSSAVEVFLTLGKVRNKLLAKWLRKIFDQPSLKPDGKPNTGVMLGEAIMDHCMLTALSKEKKSTSYMKAETFVSAFLDQITRTPPAAVSSSQTPTPTPSPPPSPPSPSPPSSTTTSSSFQSPSSTLSGYITAITATTVISGELKRVILAFANESVETVRAINVAAGPNGLGAAAASAKSDLDLFREKLEGWYNDNGERLTSSFKRKWAFPLTLIVAIIMTISLNVDSVVISKYLYSNKEASKDFADRAMASYNDYKERVEKIKSDSVSNKDKEDLARLSEASTQMKEDINTLKTSVPSGFPIGWNDEIENQKKIHPGVEISKIIKSAAPGHIPGWIATILALLLGAPFWFDLLNKIGSLRGSGAKPASDKDDDKK